MPVPVTMPKFGLTMTEGTVAHWLVAEGDRVTKDQPLAEIETELINLLTDNANERIIAFYREKLSRTLEIVDHVKM